MKFILQYILVLFFWAAMEAQVPITDSLTLRKKQLGIPIQSHSLSECDDYSLGNSSLSSCAKSNAASREARAISDQVPTTESRGFGAAFADRESANPEVKIEEEHRIETEIQQVPEKLSQTTEHNESKTCHGLLSKQKRESTDAEGPRHIFRGSTWSQGLSYDESGVSNAENAQKPRCSVRRALIAFSGLFCLKSRSQRATLQQPAGNQYRLQGIQEAVSGEYKPGFDLEAEEHALKYKTVWYVEDSKKENICYGLTACDRQIGSDERCQRKVVEGENCDSETSLSEEDEEKRSMEKHTEAFECGSNAGERDDGNALTKEEKDYEMMPKGKTRVSKTNWKKEEAPGFDSANVRTVIGTMPSPVSVRQIRSFLDELEQIVARRRQITDNSRDEAKGSDTHRSAVEEVQKNQTKGIADAEDIVGTASHTVTERSYNQSEETSLPNSGSIEEEKMKGTETDKEPYMLQQLVVVTDSDTSLAHISRELKGNALFRKMKCLSDESPDDKDKEEHEKKPDEGVCSHVVLDTSPIAGDNTGSILDLHKNEQKNKTQHEIEPQTMKKSLRRTLSSVNMS